MKKLISLYLVSALIFLTSCKTKSDSDESSISNSSTTSSKAIKDKWGGMTKSEFMSDKGMAKQFQDILRELGFKGESIYKYDKDFMECYYDSQTAYLKKIFPNGSVEGINHRYRDTKDSFNEIINPCLKKITQYK